MDLEGEEIFIRSKSGNIITVDRGRDGTPITEHLAGAELKSITQEDNSLIEMGDAFGFDVDTF